MNPDTLPLVLIGAGGHAKVLAALASAAGYPILGVCDPALAADAVSNWGGLEVLGDDGALERLDPDRVALMLGIGQLAKGNLRERVYITWRERGYYFPALVHPAAWVAPDVVLSSGVQVMAGAIIQPGCEVGENSIINTRASVDHDCRIGRDVHVAPGATLCGSVKVEDGAFIGAGTTLIQGIHVGRSAIVGAGVTLVRDLSPKTTIIGATNRQY
jgi:sugar O-acyltransferase (sialic acid O-acetyltransferase NeuD family)